ncbi:TVP38/TMEM64 family protein [Candidatus Pelagibacter sp. HIMB1493]|uniref:TVP38/TMEM64 family protein n=1 Tax=Candidatus Pelagibacter sp. HIMB1493 TaxID=3413334 RepID=UPI003F873C5F
MEKTKKIKLFIGLSYLLIVSLFLYFFFSKFSLQEITSYDFLRNNRSYLIELKNSNLFLVLISFLFLTVLWVFPFLGFGSPVALMGGFIFGKWIGAIIVAAGLTIGATFLYIFGNYFLKELIREKFLNKFQNLEKKFQKSEFIYLLIYRIIGGIPWQLQSLLPLLFNVKIKNYFFSTFFGIIPGVFLIASIGSGIEKIIDHNSKVPKISDIIFSPDIYLPLLAFFVLIISTILFRKRFYKD